MSADDLLQFLTQALFVLIFLVVLRQAIRQPLRANVDIALLFGVFSLIIAEGVLLRVLDIENNRVLSAARNGSACWSSWRPALRSSRTTTSSSPSSSPTRRP